MLARRSTLLLVYSIESPFGSFIDFFSARYENSFEWPDGTRGLLKADERVYFSLTENPKWRSRYENTRRMVVHGKCIKFQKSLSDVRRKQLAAKDIGHTSRQS